MASFPFIFRPLPGRFGNLLELASRAVGTGGTTIGNSGTTTVVVPTPNTKAYVDRVSISATTAATSSGDVTAQWFKQSGATKTALTAATSLKSDVITESTGKVYSVTVTGSDAERLLQPGDCIVVDLVAAGTVSAQPVANVQVTYSVVN